VAFRSSLTAVVTVISATRSLYPLNSYLHGLENDAVTSREKMENLLPSIY